MLVPLLLPRQPLVRHPRGLEQLVLGLKHSILLQTALSKGKQVLALRVEAVLVLEVNRAKPV